MYMNCCLENCILDTSLPSLGREIKPQEEGGDKTRALVSRQPVYWFVLGNRVPHPPAQPPDVKCTVLCGRRLPLKAAIREDVCSVTPPKWRPRHDGQDNLPFPCSAFAAAPEGDQQLTLQCPHGSWGRGHRCVASLEKLLAGTGVSHSQVLPGLLSG